MIDAYSRILVCCLGFHYECGWCDDIYKFSKDLIFPNLTIMNLMILIMMTCVMNDEFQMKKFNVICINLV
jgi:predicted 3-demethylubiquinone-9 3-methyltransferase (glyoxalase superfamily)